MAYEAHILADSISAEGHRLTTMEVSFPRFVLAEFNTHRVLSRNSASSRAIPVEKQLARVLDDPFIPISWGINQPGMQADEELDDEQGQKAEKLWIESRNQAVLGAVALIGGLKALKDRTLVERVDEIARTHGWGYAPLEIPVHKQVANRLLEPFMWHTAIVTATEWDNFYALRANKEAQPEIRMSAETMLDAQQASEPTLVHKKGWHLPLIHKVDYTLAESIVSSRFEIIDVLKKVAVGRCARVSYLTHDGHRDLEKDVELYERLASSGHMSPLEHIARPMNKQELDESEFSGNFRGWHQFRKDIPNEDNFAKVINRV